MPYTKTLDPNIKTTDYVLGGETDYVDEANIENRLGGTQYGTYQKAYGVDPEGYYAGDPGWENRGGIVGQQWIDAMNARRASLADVAAYEARIRGGRSAAQEQLLGGIRGQRQNMRAQAQARGNSPAMGRAAGYAGGALAQRGQTQQDALQAQELAYAEQLRQQALSGAQQGAMALGAGRLQQHGIQTGMTGLQSQLAAQAIAEQGAQDKARLGAGLAAAGAAGAQIGGMGGDSGGGSSFFGSEDTSYADAKKERDLENYYSDIRLKQDVRAPAPQQESILADVLAQDRGEQAMARRERDMMLRSLVGSGKRYEYNQAAQRQLGQPDGDQYGPMAQDLEKSELGKGAVIATPAGKMVDTGRLAMIGASLSGRLKEEQDELKRRLARLEKGSR